MNQSPTPPPDSDETIFAAALDRLPAERAAFLESACAGDAARRARIEGLLRAHESAEQGFMATAAPAAPRIAEPAAGQMIGRYKLLQKLGEGGCGTVYMAEQEEPVRRRVALKVIKLGMDTKEVIARFSAEQQALALMDHTNIARVFDAGATESGRPFFVMELVRGIPITKFCDEQNLPTAARLELFTQVCHAVQHAHQKGIIHRDIKPSNILVTLHDGVPVPKVIDFGIAKATQGRLTDATLFTAFEQFIGTPAYMSPEQAEMSGLDIDTRSDIYSLGVLLYELLTGRPPFDPKSLLSAGLDEIRRIIREVEPPRMSTRLSTLNDLDRATIAKSRSTLPAHLSTLLRGDLDWIVVRCLEKDRARRYETANGLALDVLRHLRDEAVVARPPTPVYRLQKLITRNRRAVAAATAVVIALVAGTIVSAWQAVRATRAEFLSNEQRLVAVAERQRAEHAQNEAESARTQEAALRVRAEADEEIAQTEAARSAQVAKFMRDMLTGVGPSVALGRDTILLREILDKTAERIAKDLPNQPDVAAELRTTLGGVYRELAEYGRAETMHREALAARRKLLGVEHPLVAASLDNLAEALRRQSSPEKQREAEALAREAVSMRKKLLGDDHLDVATSLNRLGLTLGSQMKFAEAEAAQREALAIRRKQPGGEQALTPMSISPLVQVLARRGKLDEAEALAREALERSRTLFANEPFRWSGPISDLAMVFERQNKSKEAEPLYRETLGLRRTLWGNDHLELTDTLIPLGNVLTNLGKLEEAEALRRETLALRRKRLGPQHPDLAASLDQLAGLLKTRGKLAEAESVHREALAMRTNLFGPRHAETARSLNNLAGVRLQQGEFTEAETLYRDAISIRKPLPKNTHSDLATSIAGLGYVFRGQGGLDEAEAHFREALAIFQSVVGNRHERVVEMLNSLATVFSRQRRFGEATASYTEALEIRRHLHGAEHPLTLTTMSYLAYAHRGEGHHDQALPLYAETFEGRKRVLGAEHPDTITSMNHLAGAYRSLGKMDDAVSLLREALGIQKRVAGLDHPETIKAIAALAVYYHIQRRGPEALPLYREALEIQKRVLGSEHLDTLITATNYSRLLVQMEKFAVAEPILRDLLAARTKRSADDWHAGDAKLHLGEALVGQRRFDEAEPFLREGFRNVMDRADPTPAGHRSPPHMAAERLARLFTTFGQHERAADWQEKLATLVRPEKSSAAPKP